MAVMVFFRPVENQVGLFFDGAFAVVVKLCHLPQVFVLQFGDFRFSGGQLFFRRHFVGRLLFVLFCLGFLVFSLFVCCFFLLGFQLFFVHIVICFHVTMF